MRGTILDTPVEYLKGVGPVRAKLLKEELNVIYFADLLQVFPIRYIDRTIFHHISDINSDLAIIQVKARVVQLQSAGSGRSMRLSAMVSDDTGTLELIWFQGIRWAKAKLQQGKEYIIFGKPGYYNGRYSIAHPELEEVAGEAGSSVQRMQPVYSSSEKMKANGFDSKGMARIIHSLIQTVYYEIQETLPILLLQKFRLIDRRDAFLGIHFPQNEMHLRQSTRRLKFEELFFIQIEFIRQKLHRQAASRGHHFSIVGRSFNRFYNEVLPFPLTGAQKRVIREIRADMAGGHQMNRLLQGDVGSGKTIVALFCMLIAIDNGFQACLLAPTEILANQHFQTLKKWADAIGVTIALLTGSIKQAVRSPMLRDLASGGLQILVGTHAILEDPVVFSQLGLVVIDEQHRFGVEQRAAMWQKSVPPPHILVMTATPIPRTMAMAFYGDLDYSVIDELPPGRKQVATRHFTDSARIRVFSFMRQEIAKGRQVYVVFPLIHESESLDLKDIQDGFEAISRDFPLPEYAVSIVHGQLKPDEKEYEMKRFVKGETQIMVATTVIEVGVDVPNASVMVIENAERFGLSQLHQLRGRVGRGADQSYCILMTKDKISVEARQRIETMVRTTDGFAIAEADLQIRGPGDLKGTRQSGAIELHIADLTTDGRIVEAARQSALEVLTIDPELSLPGHRALHDRLVELTSVQRNLSRIS
ncbi:MAG TPA: ATP-dependent DNA helicase RecG [Bacteroidales bacterium]|nr:MAG: ATP-dependent DNA helicase RecG [Bacteroidetes bacterium GWE2_42_24]OFY25944.1 MAG: ATP-dependent DNA helicase RecG [Bacteroidetes bacterium GWF2_43_11]HBZ66648.1 ATP-dependent DNA helicase RecG [Bacteroidales bacterium]